MRVTSKAGGKSDMPYIDGRTSRKVSGLWEDEVINVLYNYLYKFVVGIAGTSHRNLLASRSDSSKVRRSPSRTGPFTFLMICRFSSPRNSTFTCVHWPWEPVRPRTLITRARTTGFSIAFSRGYRYEKIPSRK
jgi:hypothetical protein